MIEYIDEIDEEFGNENNVEYQCGCGCDLCCYGDFEDDDEYETEWAE